MTIKRCDMCEEAVMDESDLHNPRIGVDEVAGDWMYAHDVALCTACWDEYCTRNNLGTLEDALDEGVNIVFFPFASAEF